jgi:hypothetical protein
VRTTVLVDSHVHFYPCFDKKTFFRSAARNFSLVARSHGLEHATGILVLTEARGFDYFHRFLDECENEPRACCLFRKTAEDSSLLVLGGDVDPLIVIAGRQLVTVEGLEVLALGCRVGLPDGLLVRDTLEAVREVGALPIVPWGFGKWWRRRGRLVSELVLEEGRNGLFLGDNGGRPRLGRRPRQFRRAEKHGVLVIPGSDPLPLPGQEQRVGSFGFRIRGVFDPECPTAGLKALLREPTVSPTPFGAGEGIVQFVRNQLLIRIRKGTVGSFPEASE